MNGLETMEAEGYLDGACFGRWDISTAECSKCLVMKYCEEETKRGASPLPDQEEPVAVSENGTVPLQDISPLEYLLDLLRGRFDYKTNENDQAVAHYFVKDDKTVFTIFVSKTNSKVKLRLANGESKVVNAIESIEQVEGLVKEMLG